MIPSHHHSTINLNHAIFSTIIIHHSHKLLIPLLQYSHLLSCPHFCTPMTLETCSTEHLWTSPCLSELTYPLMTFAKDLSQFSKQSLPLSKTTHLLTSPTQDSLSSPTQNTQLWPPLNFSDQHLQQRLQLWQNSKFSSDPAKSQSGDLSQLPESASFLWFKFLWCFFGLKAPSRLYLHCRRWYH